MKWCNHCAFVVRRPRLHIVALHCYPTDTTITQSLRLDTCLWWKGLFFWALQNMHCLALGKHTDLVVAAAGANKLFRQRRVLQNAIMFCARLCIHSSCVAFDSDPTHLFILNGLALHPSDTCILLFYRTLFHCEKL